METCDWARPSAADRAVDKVLQAKAEPAQQLPPARGVSSDGTSAPVVQREGRSPLQAKDGGSSPTPALQPVFTPKQIVVRPIPHLVARDVCRRKHYLGSYPGGAQANFGVFVGSQLLGIAVLAVGPANLPRLFGQPRPYQVLCLSRFWLDDRLRRNAESRTLAVILRQLRQHQGTIKAVVAYSDPQAGHSGTIYRAAGFLYLGQSEVMPLYRLPDGSVRHSRSLSHAWGTHSRRHFASHGVALELIPQVPKHIYVALVDPFWRDRLTRPVLPYPPKVAK